MLLLLSALPSVATRCAAQEEMVLDEAEMPESMFRSKYETLNRFRAEMVSRMEKMKGMSPQVCVCVCHGLRVRDSCQRNS